MDRVTTPSKPCVAKDHKGSGAWNIDKKILDESLPFDRSFFLQETSNFKTPDYYMSRLKMLGFSGKESLLDAGCGIGQWTIAMSMLNKQSTGIDIRDERLSLADALAKGMNINNIRFQHASLESLPFPNAAFDACLCYNTITSANNTERCIKEIYRVLKQGSRVYFSATTIEFYAKQAFRCGNFKELKSILGMVVRAIIGKGPRAISEKKLRRLLTDAGFIIIGSGDESSVSVDPSIPMLPPALPGKFCGIPMMYEILAEKI